MIHGKRLLCLFLALALVVGIFPTVRAADPVTVYIDPAAGADTNDGFTEAAPVQTLAAAYEKLAAGGTLVFLSDLTWSTSGFFPSCAYPVTITSKTGAEGIIASANMRMQSDTTFTNITLTFNNAGMMMLSGEGHDLTVESDVQVVRNTSNQVNITAAARFTPSITASPTLTVKAGKWNYIYAVHGINLTGDMTVVVDGATCTYISPDYNALITGNVNITVKSGEVSNIYLQPSHADGKITGNLNVTLSDNANVTKVLGSKGVVQGAATVTLDGADQTLGTLTGTGTGSSLVLRSGTWNGTASGFGAASIDVAEGKTLSLASAFAADTVACAGTLDFQTGGSLNAAAVTGTVNCTLSGEVLTNKAFVTAPTTADIRFPEDSGVVANDGKWMILDKENFKGLIIKAESDVTMTFYKDHDRETADKIQPDYKETIDGYTYYYFAGISGYYCYDAVRAGCYKIYQRLYVTTAERDAGHIEEVVMEEKANPSKNEWDHSYYYGQVDEFIEKSENDMTEKWHTDVELVTPVFTNPDKPAHQMTTQPELEAFISDLDAATSHMYVFSIGKSAKYQHDIPIVFFTNTDLSGCKTLEDVAAALEQDGLPNIGYKAQMHGDEHAAGEGALNVLYQLCKDENKTLLDTINIYVMPRINPDGAQECQRNLRSQSMLFEDVDSNTDPNRHMLHLGSHESRLYLKTVQLFDPVAELDGHERQRSSNIADNQIGTSWRYGTSAELLDIQVDLVTSMFAALEAVDLSGAWYSNNVNTTPGQNTRSYAANQARIHLLMETRGIYLGNECYGSRTASHIVSAMAYLNFCAEHVDEMAELVAAEQADQILRGKTYEDSDTLILSGKTVAHPEYNKITEKFNFANGNIDTAYEQTAYLYEPGRTRVAPTAYVIPKGLPREAEILELMELQEIDYYALPANTAISLQQYSGVVDSDRKTTGVTLSTEQYFTFPTGCYVFQMDQVNAYVLGKLMEADDASADLVEQGRISVNEDGTVPIYRYIHDLTEDEIGVAYTIAQAAPTGLSATKATSAANDGVISGLSADKLYEYKAAGDDAYTQLPAGTTEITGLAPNAYYIRYQADASGAVGLDAECVIGCSATVYLSAATGSDENAGTTEAAALATLEGAYAKLSQILGASGDASDGTIILVDDYTIETTKAVNLPAHTYPVSILGKTASVKLIFKYITTEGDEASQQLRFHGPTTLDNFEYRSATGYKYDFIFANGNKLVIGEKMTCTTNRNYPRLIAGDYKTVVADTDLTVKGGRWNVVCSNSMYRGCTGTVNFTVTGGTISSIWQCYYGNSSAEANLYISGVSVTNTMYLGAQGSVSSYSNTFSGNTTLTLGEGFVGKIYTGSSKKGSTTGTVTIVADGVDLSKVTLTNAPGADAVTAGGTVAKGVLVYASGNATPVAGFDEYHINTAAGGTVTLTDDLTVDKIIGGGTLELAGKNLTGKTALTVEGNLTVTDNTTDDFDVSDGTYGKLVGITGNVVGGDGYVKLNENSGISFHKAKLDITTVTLRPSATGIYYTGDFTYDDAVENGMDHYGIVTSLYETEPVVADEDYVDDDATTGEYRSLYTRDSGTGALIADIMEAGDENNAQYADMPIYVRAYVQSGDDITYGETVSVTLRQLVQAIDKKFTSLNETQQEALKDMYLAFSAEMADWKIPHLKNYVS